MHGIPVEYREYSRLASGNRKALIFPSTELLERGDTIVLKTIIPGTYEVRQYVFRITDIQHFKGNPIIRHVILVSLSRVGAV
jgi:hypothetical protein